MTTFQTRPQEQVSAIQVALTKKYGNHRAIQAGDTLYLSYGRNQYATELFVLGYGVGTFPQHELIVTTNRAGEIVRVSQDASNISLVTRHEARSEWQVWALVGFWASKKASRFRKLIRQLACKVETLDTIIAAQDVMGWQWQYQGHSTQEWNEAILPENEKRMARLMARAEYYEAMSKLAYELAKGE